MKDWIRILRRTFERFSFVAITLLVGAQPALATHEAPKPAGDHSVDGEFQIDYQDSTRYDDAIKVADQAWSPLEKITIRPDSAFEVEDLDYKDDNNCTNKYVAIWKPNFAADDVFFVICQMDGLSTVAQNEVGAHELGHGLGLADIVNRPADNPGTAYNENEVMLMIKVGLCHCTAPRWHDEADYTRRWQNAQASGGGGGGGSVGSVCDTRTTSYSRTSSTELDVVALC